MSALSVTTGKIAAALGAVLNEVRAETAEVGAPAEGYIYMSASASWTNPEGAIITLTFSVGAPPDEDDDEATDE